MVINSFRVSLPGYQGNLQAAISHTSAVSSWERFGVEMILTFVVVFTYFVSTNSQRKLFGNSATMIGAAYSACNFVSVSFYLEFDLNCTNVLRVEIQVETFSCSTSQNDEEHKCKNMKKEASLKLFLYHFEHSKKKQKE